MPLTDPEKKLRLLNIVVGHEMVKLKLEVNPTDEYLLHLKSVYDIQRPLAETEHGFTATLTFT
jgi:hypothetical protein